MFRKAIVPFAVFVGIMVFLAKGLTLKPGEVPSPFVGKPAPNFELPSLMTPESVISESTLAGKPWLLNVWASWCAACRDEHPLLNELSANGVVDIVGLNYKDARSDALGWLDVHGNPYTEIAVDLDGAVGIEYGVYGVPETFVIDSEGIVRMKHIGPLTAETLTSKLLPLLLELGTRNNPS